MAGSAFLMRGLRQQVSGMKRLVGVCVSRDACGFHEFWRAQALITIGGERVVEAMAALPLQPQRA